MLGNTKAPTSRRTPKAPRYDREIKLLLAIALSDP